MAVASLAEILDELATQIRTAMEAVDDVAVQVEPGWVPTPTPPTIDVFPGESPSRDLESAAFGDLAGGYLLTVRARVDTGDATAAHSLLVAFCDDEDDLSVPAAIMSDPTLNGYAASMDITRFSGFLPYQDVGSEGGYVGCEWAVLVIPGWS